MAGATSEWTLIGYLSRHVKSVLPTWDFQLCSLFVWSGDQTSLVLSKWLNTDLILKFYSKNLSQYPIKPTEQASSITLCLQYRCKSSFPRMHMANSSYSPCNSSILAAFFPFSCFGFLCGAGLQIISRLAPVKLSGQTYFCSDISHFWQTNIDYVLSL